MPFCPPPRPPQRRWAPGTQCITKCEHTRPKPGELAFHKGDVVTILEACEVSGGPGAWRCLGRCASAGPPPPTPHADTDPWLPPWQNKSWYRAKHHASGQEGLLAAGALREREALSADPKLSLMP